MDYATYQYPLLGEPDSQPLIQFYTFWKFNLGDRHPERTPTPKFPHGPEVNLRETMATVLPERQGWEKVPYFNFS